ncbi:LOW QUALITY PROTEIN: hypothetical protein MAR_017607 [Mya arenaria]|uniref:Uncharacterized protein n=1 Tax=Mya arenaria TaxID=6604 RepID=A0ABY7EET1_MYAAR|nr:LOW QUALITY PROTEIN: hypothetical protein MAR_017607 [Mya arenaria]
MYSLLKLFVTEEKLPIVQTLPDVTKEKKVEEPVVQPHHTVVKVNKRSLTEWIARGYPMMEKERRERPCTKHVEEEKKEALPPPPDDAQKKQSWIFETEDFTEEKEEKVLAKLISTDHAVKKWRKPGNRDSSYTDELRRLELAEERRKKQQEMFERLKARKLITMNGDQDDGSPKFEDCKCDMSNDDENPDSSLSGKNYQKNVCSSVLLTWSYLEWSNGFLAKYCIFTKGNIEMYRHAFEAGEDVMIALHEVNNKLTLLFYMAHINLCPYFCPQVDDTGIGWLEGEDVMIALREVDDTGIGWLEGEDVMIALRGVNNKLTEAEEEYLYRVLELTGYQITHGADFKTHWMKNLIGQMDFKALEMKMFKCRSLWECNVDKETNSIPIDQLCVDLRAGGVSLEHELEVREKLSHLHALDLLDFLTYTQDFDTVTLYNSWNDSTTSGVFMSWRWIEKKTVVKQNNVSFDAVGVDCVQRRETGVCSPLRLIPIRPRHNRRQRKSQFPGPYLHGYPARAGKCLVGPSDVTAAYSPPRHVETWTEHFSPAGICGGGAGHCATCVDAARPTPLLSSSGCGGGAGNCATCVEAARPTSLLSSSDGGGGAGNCDIRVDAARPTSLLFSSGGGGGAGNCDIRVDASRPTSMLSSSGGGGGAGNCDIRVDATRPTSLVSSSGGGGGAGNCDIRVDAVRPTSPLSPLFSSGGNCEGGAGNCAIPGGGKEALSSDLACVASARTSGERGGRLEISLAPKGRFMYSGSSSFWDNVETCR